MGDKKSKWDQLSLSQKAGLIKIYVNNGFSDIDSIREDYNKNVDNFQSNDANFVQRLRDNDPKYIQNPNGSVSTHKLNYATDDNGAIIYPSVQEQNGTLVDHSKDNMGGLESAIQQKDTVRTSIPFAEWYTKNYKSNYSEFFNRYNKFAGGGGIFSKLFKGKQKEEEQTTENIPIEEDTRGKYLPNNIREYFRYYKDYDDWYKRGYPKVQENLKEASLSRADYFFSKNPNNQSYYELTYGPYSEFIRLRNKYEKNKKYSIPIGETTYRLKSIVNGKPTNKHTLAIHEDLLNYIYDEAIKAGVSPKTAIALATQESNLGIARANNNNINLFDLFSYWRGTDSVLYPNSKLVDPHNALINKYKRGEEFTKEDLETIQDLIGKYNTMVNTIHEYKGNSVVGDAVRLFDSGKYNPGDKNYINTVNSRFNELMNDERFRNWWETKQKLSKN